MDVVKGKRSHHKYDLIEPYRAQVLELYLTLSIRDVANEMRRRGHSDVTCDRLHRWLKKHGYIRGRGEFRGVMAQQRSCEGCGASFDAKSAQQKCCFVCVPEPRRGRFKRYGLTQKALEMMLSQQNARCPGCLQSLTLEIVNIDHNHVTSAIRGLLCGPCNRGIGQLRDDPMTLRRLASYLEQAKC